MPDLKQENDRLSVQVSSLKAQLRLAVNQASWWAHSTKEDRQEEPLRWKQLELLCELVEGY